MESISSCVGLISHQKEILQSFLFCFSEVPFDFVFLIPLRNVNKGPSLTQLVIQERDQLHDEDTDLIRLILKGKTNHKVLLILDGYDEYTPRTNSDIDKVVEAGIGKCMCILTSRPELACQDDVLEKTILQKMASEAVIEGFSDEKIEKCCAVYLCSEDTCTRLIKHAKESGIRGLLSTPILLLMICVLFNEDQALPDSRTQIYKTIYDLTMDRTTLKTMQCKSAQVENIDQMLRTLGKFSWEALQNDTRQLLINKVFLYTKTSCNV